MGTLTNHAQSKIGSPLWNTVYIYCYNNYSKAEIWISLDHKEDIEILWLPTIKKYKHIVGLHSLCVGLQPSPLNTFLLAAHLTVALLSLGEEICKESEEEEARTAKRARAEGSLCPGQEIILVFS